MTAHLSDLEVEQWISGTLEPHLAAVHEEHARVCPACEARLQQESRLELLLGEAARPTRAPHARWLVAAGPAALAAALALVFFFPPSPSSASFPDAGLAHVLADETHFEGEAPPPEALTARAPFSL